MKSSLTIKRVFLPRSYTAEYCAEFTLFPDHLCVLVDRSLKELVPVGVFRGEALVNIKGRDPANVLHDNWQGGARPKGDELAFISGILPAPGAEGEAEDFTVRVSSRFKSFPSNTTIEHATDISRSYTLPAFLKTQELARVFPLKLSAFRLGLEYFHNSYRGPLSGLSPEVTESIVVDCIGEQVKVMIVAEKLKKKNALPFENSGLFKVFAAIVNEVSACDLFQDYLNQVQ